MVIKVPIGQPCLKLVVPQGGGEQGVYRGGRNHGKCHKPDFWRRNCNRVHRIPSVGPIRASQLPLMDISHEGAKDAAFIISSRPRPLQKTSGTLGPGLVIQHRGRMFMFQAKHLVEVVSKFISCFRSRP